MIRINLVPHRLGHVPSQDVEGLGDRRGQPSITNEVKRGQYLIGRRWDGNGLTAPARSRPGQCHQDKGCQMPHAKLHMWDLSTWFIAPLTRVYST